MLREKFETILSSYVAARQQPYGKTNATYREFGFLADELEASEPARSRPSIRVVPSTGKGNWAKVPWIAFLDQRETSTTQRGVYCVYLFRQDMSGVYLTFNQGVTEPKNRLGKPGAYTELRAKSNRIRASLTHLSSLGFSLADDISLKADPGLGADYEPSTIAHKFYPAGNVPSDDVLFEDLDQVLDAYQEYVEHASPPVPTPTPTTTFLKASDGGANTNTSSIAKRFHADATDASVGLTLTDELALRLIASLLSKRFLILTGLSGSGKTRIAQAFAQWITPLTTNNNLASEQYLVVPVGPDWTTNESILGYPDGLNPSLYVSTPALRLILQASAQPEKPHFLILDEMNLSHVERYFADVLSAIESEEPIPLYEAQTQRGDIPTRLVLPDNLFVIGTVNVDETTYMFSPKVLDRANVIEFRVGANQITDFLRNPSAPRIEHLAGKGEDLASEFLSLTRESNLLHEDARTLFEREMLLFFDILQRHDLEFGFRVAHEASKFLGYYQLLSGAQPGDVTWFDHGFDAMVAQKMLPKLHGSRSKLEGLLWALALACGDRNQNRSDPAFSASLAAAGEAQDAAKYSPSVFWSQLASISDENPAAAARYPISFDKVIRMWRRIERDQFTSFAEA